MINKNINYLNGPDSLRDIEESEKNETPTGSFHGPDNPNQAPYQPHPFSFTGSLHGPDVIGSHIPAGGISIHDGHLGGYKSDWLTRSVTIPNIVPPLCNELTCADTVFSSGDPNYYFVGNITEQVLHNYWDKAINMWGLFMKVIFPYKTINSLTLQKHFL